MGNQPLKCTYIMWSLYRMEMDNCGNMVNNMNKDGTVN